MTSPRAVLVTGVFGAGKTSVVAEMADLLDRHGLPYAAIDLDWLMWFSTGAPDPELLRRVLLANLEAVVGNYRGHGVCHFVLALFVSSRDELDALRRTIDMDLTVVRLEAPAADIERRLGADVTTGRTDDLRRAMAALERGEGVGLEDVVVENRGPIAHTARWITEYLGWLTE